MDVDEKQIQHDKDRFNREATLVNLLNQIAIFSALKCIVFNTTTISSDAMRNQVLDLCDKRTDATIDFLKRNVKMDE